MFEEMITPNFPETMEEEVFTDTWPTAYLEEKKKKAKCINQKKMHLKILWCNWRTRTKNNKEQQTGWTEDFSTATMEDKRQ